jgi:hypothetical protein
VLFLRKSAVAEFEILTGSAHTENPGCARSNRSPGPIRIEIPSSEYDKAILKYNFSKEPK